MPSTEIQAGLSEHPEDEIVQSEIEGARRKKKSGKGRIIAIVVSVAVIAGVFAFALPKIANYGDVWDVVKSLSWEWIAALVARGAAQHGHLRAAMDGGAARPLVLARDAGDARLDGHVDGRARGRRRRDGDLVRDAEGVGLQRAAGRDWPSS